MKKDNLSCVATFAAIGFALWAGMCSAIPLEVTLWRGETRAVLLPDSVEAENTAESGVNCRVGALRTVKYAPSTRGLQRLEAYDRVVWGAKPEGPRVLEITTSATATPGTYWNGEVQITVLPRVLPAAKDWKYFLDLWQHPWAVARVAGVKPFSKAHYAAMRPVWELLAGAGQKTLTVTLVDKPWDHQCYDAYRSMIGRVKKADGSWVFDYSLFDEYVAFGRECGLGPVIACYTMCPWGYICDYKTESGEVKKVECKPGTAAFEDYWGAFLTDFAAHLKAKGWFEDAYIAMDERTPEDVLLIANFVQKMAPGMKIAMAGNRSPSDFKGIKIDYYSQALGYVSPSFLAEVPERQEKGYFTTHYICCGPDHPNTFMKSPLGEAFWNGVYPAIVGLDGFLRWAWNSWPADATKDATFESNTRYWLPGDTFLVYPNAEPSWRFLDLRNGIIAAEKLNILKKDATFSQDIAALKGKFDLQKALKGEVNFVGLAEEVQKLVNRK